MMLTAVRWMSLFAVIWLFTFETSADARPAYGGSCISCHGNSGFGNTVLGSMMEIEGTSLSEIPPGAFGDPDRGVGPLPTYTTTPGGTFQLVIHLDTPSEPFIPERFAVGLKNVYRTDPDFQAGNPDPFTWRDDQLVLVGAEPYGKTFPPVPAPLPEDESDWVLYTYFNDVQYYASTGDGGHYWDGPVTIQLEVTVPSGVIPGWYDLQLTTAGWDVNHASGPFAFVDQSHFYLNVVPEPSAWFLAASGLLLLYFRRQNDLCLRFGKMGKITAGQPPISSD